jgi:hypothetical protein
MVEVIWRKVQMGPYVELGGPLLWHGAARDFLGCILQEIFCTLGPSIVHVEAKIPTHPNINGHSYWSDDGTAGCQAEFCLRAATWLVTC